MCSLLREVNKVSTTKGIPITISKCHLAGQWSAEQRHIETRFTWKNIKTTPTKLTFDSSRIKKEIPMLNAYSLHEIDTQRESTRQSWLDDQKALVNGYNCTNQRFDAQITRRGCTQVAKHLNYCPRQQSSHSARCEDKRTPMWLRVEKCTATLQPKAIPNLSLLAHRVARSNVILNALTSTHQASRAYKTTTTKQRNKKPRNYCKSY